MWLLASLGPNASTNPPPPPPGGSKLDRDMKVDIDYNPPTTVYVVIIAKSTSGI